MFVHCIVWAKDLLFAKLFGDKKQENDLFVSAGDGSDSVKPTDIFERGSDEDHEQYGRKIYDHVFGYNIEVALANEETWKSRRRPNPIFLKDVLPERLILQNGNLEKNFLTEELPLSAMSSVGPSNPQDVWSLAENSRIFLEALRLFFGRREKVISCRYADSPLSGGTAKNRSSVVDFGRWRLIEGEIDHWRSIEGEIRSIEGEKGKKKKRKRKRKREEENLAPVLARTPLSPSPAVRRRAIACGSSAPVAARTRVRRRNVSSRGEKDRGD
ncbi:hypothetical protein BHE74_00032039, partial [Ensete ventricosum]